MSEQEKEEERMQLCPLLMMAGVIARGLKPAPTGRSLLTVLERSPSTVCVEGACAWWFQPRPIVMWNEDMYSEERPGLGRCGVAR